jgi:hypothetical protein
VTVVFCDETGSTELGESLDRPKPVITTISVHYKDWRLAQRLDFVYAPHGAAHRCQVL